MLIYILLFFIYIYIVYYFIFYIIGTQSATVLNSFQMNSLMAQIITLNYKDHYRNSTCHVQKCAMDYLKDSFQMKDTLVHSYLSKPS